MSEIFLKMLSMEKGWKKITENELKWKKGQSTDLRGNVVRIFQ